MAEVLDQREVDALLSAVSDRDGDADDSSSRNDLGTESQFVVQDYDFKRPERVSKDQMRALETIHETFARNFGASLSAFLRTIVEVRVATTEQLTYSEFIHSLPSPTCFNVLRAPPLEGQMCLELSPLIVYPIIDRLLGGSKAEVFIPQRPMTPLEQRLVERITGRALTTLSEVWSELAEVKFELGETESNPHLVQIVAPNEVVVVVGFEIKMGPRGGTMSLCLPFNVIEPVMAKLAAQSWLAYSRRGSSHDQIRRVTSSLTRARVNLCAHLAEATITCSELLSLSPGDIIMTDKSAHSDLILLVEGRPKFRAQLGQHRQHRALRITRPAGPDDHI
ncbi:MAG: flagellar motor switch protein FliM [Phycisphaerae bacterium]|nr:flagellar motor switch protein FliM [Phycisphaerae bacterium]